MVDKKEEKSIFDVAFEATFGVILALIMTMGAFSILIILYAGYKEITGG